MFSTPGATTLHILGITETWLKNCHTNCEIAIQGYSIERHDRAEGNGGGVSVYTRVYHTSVAVIWRMRHWRHFLCKCRSHMLNTCWLPHYTAHQMQQWHIDIIQGLHTAPPAWQDIINNHQMSQLVQDPTRVTENTETLIDHIYVSHPGNVKACRVSTIAFSDHYPVCFVRQLNASDVRKHGHTTIKYRSYKHFDQDAFLSDLGSVPWSIIELFDDVDDALHAWEMLFMDVVNVHVPLRERRVKRPRQPGWLTDDITAAMATRDSYKQRKDYINYKLCRNKVVQMIKEAKTVYYRNIIEENRHDTRALWACLRLRQSTTGTS